MFDQITKLKREIVDEEKALAEKKRQLAKFEEAKKAVRELRSQQDHTNR